MLLLVLSHSLWLVRSFPASLSIRAQLLSFLPTLYRMDINENIAIYCYRRGGTYDGICDLCLKDFPTYNDLKTHKNICINNKFVMNVLWLNVSLANYVQAVKSAPRIKDHLWCCQCLSVPTSSVFHGYTWLENEGCVLHATILAAKKERRVERTKRGRKRK